MAEMLNLRMISESYFYKIQKEYLYFIIHSTYILQQEAVLVFLRDEGLHLSNDGRQGIMLKLILYLLYYGQC